MTIAPNPSPAPEEYLPKIKEELTAIARAEGHALARAIACGQLLASAKAALEEANAKLAKSKTTSWGKWLSENLKEFGIKLSTANVYIRLYQHKDDEKVKDAKSISEARAGLPPERGGGDDDDEDEEESDDGTPVVELSDKDREQVASEFIRSHSPKKLYDQLVGLLDDKELFELYQMLEQRFAKPAQVGAAATAVANQPVVVAKPTTFPMPGLRPVA
jgi:hypothetical protein